MTTTYWKMTQNIEKRKGRLLLSRGLWSIVAVVDVLLFLSIFLANGRYFVEFLDYVTEWLARSIL